MAKKKVEFEVCDNPDCTNSYEIDSAEPYAPGYHLNGGAYHSGAGGGPVRKLYACDLPCIVPAIQAQIDEAR